MVESCLIKQHQSLLGFVGI